MGGDPMAADAALIAAAQRSSTTRSRPTEPPGSSPTTAASTGSRTSMDQTLDEESQADTLLTKIATGGMFKSGVNQQATT